MQFMGLRYLETDSFYVYYFAFGTCLIPSVAIYSASKYLDISLIYKYSYNIIVISNILLLYSILKFSNWNISQILLTRATVSINLAGQTVEIINPISVAFFGQILSIISIYQLFFPIISSKIIFFKNVILLILGFSNLILGASRGPFLIVLFLIFTILCLAFYKQNNKINFFIKIFSFFLILFIIFRIYYFDKIAEIELINRFFLTFEMIELNQADERSILFQSAWNQFLKNPILGDSFITEEPYASYPHNLFLDVLMSTGLIGMLFFVILLNGVFKKSYFFLFKDGKIKIAPVISFLFISIFLIGFTSGSLFSSSSFWLFSSYLVGASKFH
jgi:hypothetical protein